MKAIKINTLSNITIYAISRTKDRAYRMVKRIGLVPYYCKMARLEGNYGKERLIYRTDIVYKDILCLF